MTTIEAAMDLRNRAIEVALAFAGRMILTSDGTYDLLITVAQDAMREWAKVAIEGEREACAKIVHAEYLAYTEGGFSGSQCLADAEKKIRARSSSP